MGHIDNSALAQKLAIAKAKAAARAAAAGTAPVTATKGNTEEKNAKLLQLTQQREAKKLERIAKKAAKEAAKANKVPHMAKLEKAAMKLPSLSDEGVEILELAKEKSLVEISKLVAHLGFYLREKSTVASLGVSWKPEQLTRIVSAGMPGASEFIGQLAVVVESKKIHARVIPEGSDKEVYVFTSDLEAVSAEELASIEENEVNDEVQPAPTCDKMIQDLNHTVDSDGESETEEEPTVESIDDSDESEDEDELTGTDN